MRIQHTFAFLLACVFLGAPPAIAPQIPGWPVTPQGVTFTESFGDSSQPCGVISSANVCDHNWQGTVGSGNSVSIVHTPSPAPDAAADYSLNINAGGSAAVSLYHYGDFPTIPAGYTSTWTFDLYISSSSLTSGNQSYVFCLGTTFTSSSTSSATCANTNYNPASMGLSNVSGTLKVFAYGSNFSSYVTISAGVHHKIVLTVVSNGTSNFTLDGGSQYTFTSGNLPINYVLVGWESASYAGNIDIGYITGSESTGAVRSASPGGAQLVGGTAIGPANLTWWFNDSYGTNGDQITPSALSDLTNSTVGGNGLWSVCNGTGTCTGISPTIYMSTSYGGSLVNSIIVVGLGKTDTYGPSSVRYNDSTTTRYHIEYSFKTNSTAAAWGTFYQTDTLEADWRSTLMNFMGPLGTTQAIGFGYDGVTYSGHYYWRMECPGSSTFTDFTSAPEVQASHSYWITAYHDGHGNGNIAYYDASNLPTLTLITTGSCSLGYNVAMTGLALGWLSASGTGGQGDNWYFSKWKVCAAGASCGQFLLP